MSGFEGPRTGAIVPVGIVSIDGGYVSLGAFAVGDSGIGSDLVNGASDKIQSSTSSLILSDAPYA